MDYYIRSSLPQPTSIDKERVKRNGFHDDGILVVALDDSRLNWADRELLKGIGERLYGRAPVRAPLRFGNGRQR